MSLRIQRRGLMARLSDALWWRPRLLLLILLMPLVLWFGVIYSSALLALLVQSFFSVHEFSGHVDYTLTLKTYAELLSPPNLLIIFRTILMAVAVTFAAILIAFPIAYFAARYARKGWKIVFLVGVMLPLWSSYLVKVYAWKLILAEDGMLNWITEGLHLDWLLNANLALPHVGGGAVSSTGTFLVFVYVWLPLMILPIQAALERVPASILEASSDLGAHPLQTFRHVILPYAIPGMIVGSILTFSLTLGDYITPQVIGSSDQLIGQVIYQNQGQTGNAPLATAFAIVPIILMAVYLWWVKRQGALDVL